VRRGALTASGEGVEEKSQGNRVAALTRAYEFQRLLDSGEVNSRAAIARMHGISRARVTQIMNLLRLPREILDHLAGLPAQEQMHYSERLLRGVLARSSRDAQLEAFESLQTRGLGPGRRSEEGCPAGSRLLS
jgi:hypothetical protein